MNPDDWQADLKIREALQDELDRRTPDEWARRGLTQLARSMETYTKWPPIRPLAALTTVAAQAVQALDQALDAAARQQSQQGSPDAG